MPDILEKGPGRRREHYRREQFFLQSLYRCRTRAVSFRRPFSGGRGRLRPLSRRHAFFWCGFWYLFVHKVHQSKRH
jgi:hypothetical protein